MRSPVGAERKMVKKLMGQGDRGDTYCVIQKKYVRKSHVLIELVGTLDEAESALGLAASLVPEGLERVRRDLLWIQNLLFRVGFTLGGERCVSREDVKAIEEMASFYGGRVEAKGFVLHGGSPASAAVSLARSVVRRLERVFVRALDEGYLREHEETMLPLINRLADLLHLVELYVEKELGSSFGYATC